MDTQDPPIRPRYQLTRGLIGLDSEKDAMTSRCLDRKEVRHATLRAHTGTGTLVGALCTHIRRLFLSFGGPVCADRISNCPLDRVLTYKNLIYLLNLQFPILYTLCIFICIKLTCDFNPWFVCRIYGKSSYLIHPIIFNCILYFIDLFLV